MRQRTGRGSWALAALLVLGLATGGCSGGSDDDPGGGDPTSGASAASEAVVTHAKLGERAGKLSQARRQQVVDQVQKVVDGWMEAAYLGGDYPRADFADAWPGFTAGAKADAEHDGDLMSNRDLGASIVGVEPVKRAVTVDVLAAHGRPAGVTAHVLLRFTTTGDTVKDVRVVGRLYLTKGKQGWQVFGYDVTKDAR
ncbi:hypothetical protein [Nocardioides conyzicola]|uniref:Mce-associated membrane protein n=1 Tax=Nocardioides conyzicola TaxID=1651781 RepID=A0ABP8WVJ6_9ACTN